MARQSYQNIPEADLGAGIDAQSAENRLQPGFCERLLNVDPMPDGRLRKRPGRQSYKGHLPIRVESIQYTDDAEDNIILTFDSSITMAIVRSTPIVVYGRTSEAQAGDFTNTNSSHYYPSFKIVQPVLIEPGVNTIVIAGTVHGIQSKFIEAVVLEAAGLNTYSNSLVEVDDVSIDGTSFDVTVTVVNGTGTSFNTYMALADRTAEASVTFVSSTTNVVTGPVTVSVDAATHQLENFNIMATLYEEDGSGNLSLIEPEAVRITTAGEVQIDFENGTGSDIDVRVILHRVPVSQTGFGTMTPPDPELSPLNPPIEVVVPDVGSAFNIVRIYIEPTPGATLEEIKADEVTYDELAQTLTFSFVNNSPDSANYYFFYDYASLFVNSMKVSGETITTGQMYVDTSPQLSVYGIDHQQAYGTNPEERSGWVNHIDLYKSALEQKIVAGLGGVLHAESFSTLNAASNRFPNLRGRISSTTYLAPAFQSSLPATDRTNGSLVADNVDATNRVPIVSMTWDSGSSTVKCSLLFENYSASQALTTVIQATGSLKDFLTIEESPWERTNGTFRIDSMTTNVVGLDLEVDLYLEIDAIDGDDWDFSGAGFAALRTDRLTFVSTSQLLQGDFISAETFPEQKQLLGVAGTSVLLGNISSALTAPAGVRVVGNRVGKCVPLRDTDGNADVSDIVKGDSISVTNQVRTHKIHSIIVNDNAAITITGDGTTATGETEEATVASMEIGTRFIITQSDYYSGEWEVLSFPSQTSFTFAHASTESDSGTIIGKCVTIDEEITIADPLTNNIEWSVEGRFIPIDIPSSSQDLAPLTQVYTFESGGFTNQDILRSTLVNDAMYLTNGSDEVYKYDGSNIYRAGLFRWQARLFASPDVTTSAKINLGNPSLTLDAGSPSSSSTFLAATAADTESFISGERIVDDRDGALYTVRDVDNTAGTITVDRVISGTGTGTITRATELVYYARLNMVDSNGYTISSATTGTDESRLVIGADASVRLRLLAPPPLGIYDYDRIEVELFRREDNTDYRRIRTLSVPFVRGDNYINILDTDAPDVATDDDIVVSTNDPTGLGQAWNIIPRAKYLTSADGRLVLANIKAYPEIQLNWTRKSLDITNADLVAAGNSVLTIRKDETNVSSTTDMTNVVRYEWVDVSGATSVSDIVQNTSTEFTVTATGIDVDEGDWVYLFHSTEDNDHSLDYSGWFQVASQSDADNFTVRAAGDTGFTYSAAEVDSVIVASDKSDIPVPIGTDGNYFTRRGQSGSLRSLPLRVGVTRLGDAINASMRCVDRNILANANFEAWVVANAGGEYDAGQLVLVQPSQGETNIGVELDALTGAFLVYGNGINRAAESLVEADTKVYPSRVLISYTNFSEIFDAPLADPTESQSAVEINPSDGQEVTGVIPFFGESAFGAAQKSSTVIVFKTASIYVLDVNTREYQKLDSQGLGCSAPFSIAYTKDAIMFANSAGVYRLNQALKIEYIGQKLDRRWTSDVNRQQMAIMTGHHYSEGKQYKLSVPATGASSNSICFAYSHTREYMTGGAGSWTKYDSIPATGWANQEEKAFMASTIGRVFKVRDLDNERPYRDDDQAISASATLRAMDFGVGGIRKVFGPVSIHYRTENGASEGSTVESAVDLTDNFTATDLATIDANNKMQTIQYSLQDRHSTHLQIRINNNELDESMEISSVDFSVAGVTTEGIPQAGESNS